LLRKASTTRSAKKSNAGFVRIATSILSLEILASHFAEWSATYPEAAGKAQAILKRHGRTTHTPLIEFYLYPSRYPNQASLAALAPRHDQIAYFKAARHSIEAEQAEAGRSSKA
jgi:hypothetical protein